MTEIPLNTPGLHTDVSLCRAFLIHHLASLNYDDLSRWAAKRVILNSTSMYPDQGDWSDPTHATQLLMKIRHFGFNPRFDYVVLGGDILRVATTCALIAREWPKFCVLRHDRHLNGYWPFHIDVGHVGPGALTKA